MQQINIDNRMNRNQQRLAALCVAFCNLARCLSLVGTDNDAVYTRWSTVTDAGVYDAFGWNLASKGTLAIDERPSTFAVVIILCMLCDIPLLTQIFAPTAPTNPL